MGDLQRKTDPARRVVRAIARLIFAVIYLRLTKCQSLSIAVFQSGFATFLSAKRDDSRMREPERSASSQVIVGRFQTGEDRPTGRVCGSR